MESVAFSPDGALLAACGGNNLDNLTGPPTGILKLWDAKTAIEKAALVSHKSRVTSVAFSSDGTFSASCGYAKK